MAVSDHLRAFVYPEKPVVTTAGGLQGDDHPLEYYEDGYPVVSVPRS